MIKQITIRRFSTSLLIAVASTTLAVGLSTSVLEAQAASFDSISRIYAFGDSYSDNGASFEISSRAVNAGVPDSSILPADPALGLYDTQGRWTNGLTAVEVLSQNLSVELTDYAVGGAKTGSGNFFDWLDPFQDTGVFGQIEQFKAERIGQPANVNGLYFIFASANDFFEYLSEPNSSDTLEELAEQTVDNIAQSISDLSTLGAQQFLVINSSDLAALPGAPEFDITEESERFSNEFNELLPTELEVLSQQLKDTEIALYDHVAISNQIRANPQDYGLTNIDDPCQPVFPVEPACANPDVYYFWDENHPTRHVHKIIGEDMTRFVTAQQSESVPEPVTNFGTLMLAGALCSLAKYRRSISQKGAESL